MISKGARHEFHSRPSKSAREIVFIPTGVDSDLWHGVARREDSRLVVANSFETKTRAGFLARAQHVIAHFVLAICQAAQIDISASPQAVFFGLKSLINQPAGDLDIWAVEARNHQNSIGRMKEGKIRRCIPTIGDRAVERKTGVMHWQQCEFAI